MQRSLASVAFTTILVFLLNINPSEAVERLAVLADCYIHDLYSPEEASFTELANKWAVKVSSSRAKISSCEGSFLLGGYNISRSYLKTPNHTMIYFNFRVFFIDNWAPDTYFWIQFDNKTVFTAQPSEILSLEGQDLLCGNPAYNESSQIYVVGKTMHNESNFTITLGSNMTNNASSFGINHVQLRFVNESENTTEFSCMFTNSTTNMTLSYACECPSGHYFYSGECLPCNSTCSQCIGPTDADCIGCAVGYSSKNSTGKCVRCTDNCMVCSGPETTKCVQCSVNYFIHENSTCRQTCDYPYVGSGDTGLKICRKACYPGDYLYPNYTCRYGCSLPYKIRLDGTIQNCDYPCKDKLIFSFENLTCLSSCQAPYRLWDGYFCISPPPPPAPEPAPDPEPKPEPVPEPPAPVPAPAQPTEEVKNAKALAELLVTTGQATTSVGTSVSLVNFSNPALILLAAFTTMLKYLKYMKINFPEKLQVSLDTDIETIATIMPESPDWVEDYFTKIPLPERFEADGLHSSFVVNFWQPFFLFVLLGVIINLVTLAAAYTKEDGKIGRLLRNLKCGLRWNLFLTLFTSYYGELVLYSSMEFRTAKFERIIPTLGFFVCCAVNIFAVFVFWKMISILYSRWKKIKVLDRKIRMSKIEETIEGQYKSYEVVFEGNKEGYFIQQAFMCIFVARMYIFTGILAYIFDYPIVQAILMVIMSVFMLLYLLIARPLRNIIDLAQYVLQELVSLLVNSSVLALSIMDWAEYDHQDTRESLGGAILNCSIAFSGIGTVYLCIQVLLLVKRALKVLINFYWRRVMQRRRLRDLSYEKRTPSDSRVERHYITHLRKAPVQSYLERPQIAKALSYQLETNEILHLTPHRLRSPEAADL